MEKNARWWETYAVRYFVGTAFGIAVLMVLKTGASNEGVRDLLSAYSQDFWKDAVVLGSVGLAFCYVASAPILLLHSVRGHWNLGANADWVWRGIAIGIVVLAILLFSAVFFSDFERGNGQGLVVGFSVLFAIVGGQLILLVPALWNHLDRVVDFYEKLAKKRQIKNDGVGEYVESYRHLREHGNAKSIVLCEIALGFILSVSETNTQLVVALSLWLLPACSSWFVGTVLERRLALRADSP